ncbi:MAG: PAS domain-containing protein, partial [Methanobrevibacter sp.]
MRIEREYRRFEDIDEIRIYDGNDYYRHAPKKFDVEKLPIQELIKNVPIDIHILIPYEGGKDFIIEDLGSFTLDTFNFTHEDVTGRLLSEVSPLYFNTLYDDLIDVYTNRNTKKIRFIYYRENKINIISNTSIFFDMERIFITNDNIDINTGKRADAEYKRFDEDKTNLLENFSQTGSCHKINGKYTWSQGIYNIINRGKEEADDYYNIVFDLVIPEDKHIVDEIFNTTNKETSQFEEIIRIRTDDGILKFIEVNVYSYFDESGIIIRQGLMNDITHIHQKETVKPVDFLLDGFKNSKKLALLIEPLNKKQYEFSKGFYHIIEKDYEEYKHSRDIINNIVEKDAVERLNILIDGELNKIYETITYEVDGNPNNKKIIDLYIEKFNHNNGTHSLGFLT